MIPMRLRGGAVGMSWMKPVRSSVMRRTASMEGEDLRFTLARGLGLCRRSRWSLFADPRSWSRETGIMAGGYTGTKHTTV